MDDPKLGANMSNPEPDFFTDSMIHFISVLKEVSRDPKAPSSIRNDWHTVETWLGCRDRPLSNTDKEVIANAWRAYLALGSAPSYKMQSIFDAIPASDRSAQTLMGGELPEQIKGVFDRLLATDAEIAVKKKAGAVSEKIGMTLQRIISELSWSNPFLCSTEKARRLSLGVLVAALLSWFGWVAYVSDGFLQMEPCAWLFVLGVAFVVYLALFALLKLAPFVIKAPKTVRLLLSANLMWVFIVMSCSYILSWDRWLSEGRYFALLLMPLVGVWLGYWLWQWAKKG